MGDEPVNAIVWTVQARDSYAKILEWLVENSSIEATRDLDDKVVALLDRLSTHNSLCPPSRKLNGTRKCVVSRNISLVYQINGNDIELLTFLGNRTGHPY